MVAPTPDNLEWIRHLHLFRGLPDDILAAFLAEMTPRPFTAGEVITEAGSACEGLCLIRRGHVDLFRPVGKSIDEGDFESLDAARVGMLESRDYYSEECVLSDEDYPTHMYTARAVTDGEVYCWPTEAVLQAVNAHREMAEALRLVRKSRRWLHRRRPAWLPQGEIVYLYTGRPVVALLPRVWWIALMLLVAALLMLWGGLVDAVVAFWFTVVGGLLAIPAILLFAWEYIDWHNDYCVVTNQRVIWVDKVLFLYESRNEAPLSSVLSVGVSTDWWGRLLNYGNVVVRTYGGSVVIDEVSAPHVVASLIEEYWQRTRRRVGHQTRDQMRQAVRERIGRVPPRSVDGDTTQQALVTRRDDWLGRKIKQLRHVLQQRSEEGGVITFRKHWFLLLQRSWFWLFISAAWPVFWGIFLWREHLWLSWRWVALGFVIWLPWLLLLGYQVWDWRNDYYQITREHIMDVYRKPLGSEDKQAAPLESIENMTYERTGFLGWLLNFGNVHIRVGTTTMVFEGVARPDMVQQEIFQRMELRRRQKQEAEAERERERMLEWLKAYHEVVQEDDDLLDDESEV